MEAGGWQVMKRARMLVEQGRVSDVSFDGTLVKGTVGDGKRQQRTGMLIRGRTDVENLCSCPEARRSGILCQHALAAGLAIARGQEASGATSEPSKKHTTTNNNNKGEATGKKAFQAPTKDLIIRLAQNAARSFGRGTLSVALESAETDAGFEADFPLLAWLDRQGQTAVPPHLMLQKAHLSGFLTALQGHPRVFVGDEALRVESIPLRLPLVLAPAGEERVSLRLEVPEGILIAPSEDAPWGYLPERQAMLRVPRTKSLSSADREALFDTIETSKGIERSWGWFFQHAETLEDAFRLDSRALPKMPHLRHAEPQFAIQLEGSLNHLAALVEARYPDGPTVVPGEEADGFPYAAPDRPWDLFQRHNSAESKALERLAGAGFVRSKKTREYILKGEQVILSFFASVLPKLQQRWDVTIGERFAHMTRDIQRIRPEIQSVAHPDGGWLDVDIGFSSEDDAYQLPKHEIQRLLQVGQSHTKLRNGQRVVVDLEACEELNAVLADMEPDQEYGRYKIPADQEDYLRETLGAFANRTIDAIPQATFPEDALSDLASILRDYQKEGICWMLARTQRGLSGILADEMGLGKTLQSLATIQALHHAHADAQPHSLVVCPTSLLDNWCQEAARFTPELKPLKLHGTQRDKLWKQIPQHPLCITSYGILTRDLERFQDHPWLAIFLDEASAIKNSKTKNARAAYDVGGTYHFALTGTPIENSVRDIWSIMQFVAPGYLGTQKTFKEHYEQALSSETGAPPELQTRFRRRLRPFILRRTKRRVATELPERIEKVLSCPLTQSQRDTYTSILRAGREKVLEARDQSEGAARMTMLTTLLRLRQVCCDLRLLDAKLSENAKRPSGKLETLRDLLQSASEGGHRVLIFSQFVRMLTLLREELEASGMDHCYLDGQTQGRQAEVDRFQKGEIPVFLISLKAGGYGLNLTAADTVIHYDPWWNPAVEAQATDRAHRIGQENVVTAYKLIAEDTVEEKILRLQRRKRQVIDAALDDDEPLMQGLSAQDLEEVLEL